MSFPNGQNGAAGAVPVFLTSRPNAAASYPNNQKNLQAAVPVYFVAKPGAGSWPNGRGAGGAMPVKLVGAIGAGMGNDQSVAANAMPVWDAGGPPTPNADGSYPTDPRNPNAAIPVWDSSVGLVAESQEAQPKTKK
jgi:hypothetical protein